MRIWLTRRGWGFLLSAVGIWVGWLFLQMRDMWYLIALLVALVFLAGILSLVLGLSARFRVQLSATDPTPNIGQRLTFTAKIQHRLPMAPATRIVWEIGEYRLSSDATIAARETTVSQLEWTPTRRGHHTVRLWRIVLFEPLGLVRYIARARAGTELLVLPRLNAALAEQLDTFGAGRGIESDVGSPVASESSGTPDGAVRAYRSGDALRQVHWKQSARQGELLVNLQDSSDSGEHALLLVTARGSFSRSDDFEHAISAAATIASHWIRQGYSVRMCVQNAPAVVCRSENEILRLLAGVQVSDEAMTLADSASQTPPGTVVIGEISAEFAAQLQRSDSGGTVFTVREASDVVIPAGWESIRIPQAEEKADG